MHSRQPPQQQQPKMPLYFDNHATTPVDPRVVEIMLPFFLEHFGNPQSSQHAYGWKANAAVEHARAQVARIIGAETKEILFTSGATESIHTAILGFIESLESGRHLITTNAEHKATLEVFERAKKLGHEITILPVSRYGQITAQQVQDALQPNTVLVSVMHANNEIGSINPIGKIGALLRQKNIVFHVDAAQTVGRQPVDVRAMSIDLLSLSSHKLYGPKGVGALFVRSGQPRINLTPTFCGGGQERGMRGGTVNVPGVVGLGAACEIAMHDLNFESSRMTRLRDSIVRTVGMMGGVELNGHPTERLCNNVSFTIRGISLDTLMNGLADIAFSSSSACSTGGVSHVLQAIGQETMDPMTTTLRFGLGRFTRDEEVEYLIQRLTSVIRNARELSKGYDTQADGVHNRSNLR